MSTGEDRAAPHPFPMVRPEITIKPSRARPFQVDLRETVWWFAIPEVGDCTLWSIYDPPDWRLTSFTRMRGVREASVHGVECIELGVDEWTPEDGWQADAWIMFARLTETAAQWLGNLRVVDGRRRLYTFLDEGFDVDWGESPRELADTGRLTMRDDGTYRLAGVPEDAVDDMFGAGVFRVCVGERRFTCLRVLEIDVPPSESGILSVGYVTRQGRTVLDRRYNGRQWARHEGSSFAKQPPWDERFPDHDRIVINGVTYVHWYDCLSHTALGIEPEAPQSAKTEVTSK